VRFLGNRSPGKQGYAVARAAAARGAEVTLVSANVTLPGPGGGQGRPRSRPAQQMRAAVRRRPRWPTSVVMAAAVADFRPASYSRRKIKKTDDDEAAPAIELVRNPDILAGPLADAVTSRRR
jgi:phosphopantothenoylcysteine decarboxylase/phosphopantothenate--cysteine ligase